MPCPKCGGLDSEPLAPGVWRCRSTVIVQTGGPGLTDYRLGPPVISRAVACGFEYADGSAGHMPLCWCSTYSIGKCSSCQTPVCGLHSALWDGQHRLCGRCWDERITSRKADEAAALEEARREKEATDLAMRERSRMRLSVNATARERIAAVLQALGSRGNPGSERITLRLELSVVRPTEHRRAWLLGEGRTEDTEQERKYASSLRDGWSRKEYMVTDNGEYLVRVGPLFLPSFTSVAKGARRRLLEETRRLDRSKYRWGPFTREANESLLASEDSGAPDQRLQWTGVLKTLEEQLR